MTSNYLTPIVIPCNDKKNLTRLHKKAIHIYFNTIQLLILSSLYVWLNNEMVSLFKKLKAAKLLYETMVYKNSMNIMFSKL